MFEVIIERAKKAIEYEFSQSKFVTNIFNKKFNPDIAFYYADYHRFIENDVVDCFEIETLDEKTKDKLLDKSRVHSLSEEEKDLLVHLVTLHVARKLNALRALRLGEDMTYSELTKLYKKQNAYWFRGQEDFHYSLTPSFFRDKDDKGVVTLPSLKGYYNNKGILSKLNHIFGTGELDFNKVSFVQHAMSKTPLLDFTKDPFVAATFALHQVGELDSDSALFKLNINQPYVIKVNNQQEADKIIQSLHIEYFNNKPEISTLIKSSLFRGLVDGSLVSRVYLIDIPTNDRMRMQKGTFVLFDHVIFVDENMIVSDKTKNELSGIITKHRIKKNIKDKLRLALKRRSKFGQYDYDLLMEPYRYMVEGQKKEN